MLKYILLASVLFAIPALAAEAPRASLPMQSCKTTQDKLNMQRLDAVLFSLGGLEAYDRADARAKTLAQDHPAAVAYKAGEAPVRAAFLTLDGAIRRLCATHESQRNQVLQTAVHDAREAFVTAASRQGDNIRAVLATQ